MTSDDNPRVFLPPPLVFGGALTLGLFLDSSLWTYGFSQIMGIILGLRGMG